MSELIYHSKQEDHKLTFKFPNNELTFNTKNLENIIVDGNEIGIITMIPDKKDSNENNQPSCFNPLDIDSNISNVKDPFKVDHFEFMRKPTFENAIKAYEFSLNAMRLNGGFVNMFIASYFYLYMMNEKPYLLDAPEMVHNFYAKNTEFVTDDNIAIEDKRKRDFFNLLQNAIIKNSKEPLFYDVDIVINLVQFINGCTHNNKNELIFHFIHNVFNNFVTTYIGLDYINNRHSYTMYFIQRFDILKETIMCAKNLSFGIYKAYCVHEIDLIKTMLKSTEFKVNVTEIPNGNKDEMKKEYYKILYSLEHIKNCDDYLAGVINMCKSLRNNPKGNVKDFICE